MVWLVLNKKFIGPSACRQAIDRSWLVFMDLVEHLTKSLWNPELEHALERFSIRSYLDWCDQHHIEFFMDNRFPEQFLNYLEGKVSNPCS